jgi:hypothetical protein
MSGDDLNAVIGAPAGRHALASTRDRPHESPSIALQHEARIELLDRLLNDPDVPLEPARIWSLLAEIRDAGYWQLKAPDAAPSQSRSD